MKLCLLVWLVVWLAFFIPPLVFMLDSESEFAVSESLQFAIGFLLGVSPVALGIYIGYRMGLGKNELQ